MTTFFHRAHVVLCEQYAPNALQTDSLSLSLAISIRHYLTAVAPGLLKRESVVALAQRWLNEHLYRSRKRMGKRVQRSTGLKLFGMNDFLDAETSTCGFRSPVKHPLECTCNALFVQVCCSTSPS
jgi:hypothetical protein